MNNTAFSSHPWAITPAGAKFSAKQLHKIEGITAPKQMDRRPKEDWYGQPIEQMRTDGGLVIVPLKGVMLNCADPIYKLFGFVSHQDVMEDLKAAAVMRPKAIVVDTDSPGGSACGTPELAQLVAEITQTTNVIVHTSNLMASAAMYVAAGATYITATGSAVVGCVGSVMEHMDASQYFAEMGIEFQRFASGKYKGMGSEGIPLTEDQKQFLQDFVDESGGAFKDWISSNRANVRGEDMEGQFFTGQTGLSKGFVDQLVQDLDEVLALFR